MDHRRTLKVPAFSFSYEFQKVSLENQIALVLKAYLQKETDSKLEDILDRDKYVRIMVFKDAPHASPYQYVYARSVDELLPAHQTLIQQFEDSNHLDGKSFGEINFETESCPCSMDLDCDPSHPIHQEIAFFFTFPKTVGRTKEVSAKDLLVLDF